MKQKTTILMTGAGGAALPFLIASLKKHGYRVLTADMDPFAAGLFLADKGFVIPRADAQEFPAAIKKICTDESVDIVMPLVDEELVTVSKMKGINAIPLMPRTAFIETCLDKYRLVQELEAHGIPAPKTVPATEGPAAVGFPCIVKPRTGRGSRDVELLKNKKDFNLWKSSTGDRADRFILQEYIDGTEYTVSVVAWRDGRVQSVVPKEIISKKGITRLAVTRRNVAIDEYCTRIQECLKADGPFNVQLRCDKTGQPLLFEINPRYSTTVSLTILAGIDEIHGLVQQALHGPDAYQFGRFKEDVVLMRHNEDSAVTMKEFRRLQGSIEDAV